MFGVFFSSWKPPALPEKPLGFSGYSKVSVITEYVLNDTDLSWKRSLLTPVHRVTFLQQDAKVYSQQMQKSPISLGIHIKLSNFENNTATALKILEFVLSCIFSAKCKKLGKPFLTLLPDCFSCKISLLQPRGSSIYSNNHIHNSF